MGTGWTWYRLPPFEDNGVSVAISVGFHIGELRQVTLTDAGAQFGTSWAEWSEQRETQRAESITNWLAQRGLQPGNYNWGSISAGYDTKGGLGSASIRVAT